MLPKVICRAVRPSTGSVIAVEIPENIVQAAEESLSHSIAVDWIGKEFNWQFIPQGFEIEIPDKKDVY